MTDKVQYWLDIADYDIETADALHQTGRWLYVGFMCHQVIEKTIKAYWSYVREDDPPYTHNQKRLAAGCGLYDQFSEEQKLFIDQITPLNIEARYPSYKEEISKAMNASSSEYIIKQTKELQQWIKEKLWSLQEDTSK